MDNTALFSLSYGLYVIGVKNNEGFGGCVVDALAQVSSGSPARIALSCMKNNRTPELIKEHGEFTVSVLGQGVDPFVIADFGFRSSREADKWALVPHTVIDGLPVLDNAVAYLRCKTESCTDYDTHTLFICTVEDAQNLKKDAPLLYADYHKSLKSAAASAFSEYQKTGVAPKYETAAPAEEDAAAGEKWVCSVCGYVYDEETPFEELPDDWRCPLCGVPKSMFIKE